MVKMPDFGCVKARVRSLQRSRSPGIFFDFHFRLYMCIYVRNPGTTDYKHDTSSAGCVLQPQLAILLHTPAARQQSRKQDHTCAVVLSALHVRTGVAFYSAVAFYRALRPVELGVSSVVLMHAFCHRYSYNEAAAAAAAAVRFSWAVECAREFQLFFSASFSVSSVYILPQSATVTAVHCCVPCVTRVCAVCAVCHARMERFQTL